MDSTPAPEPARVEAGSGMATRPHAPGVEAVAQGPRVRLLHTIDLPPSPEWSVAFYRRRNQQVTAKHRTLSWPVRFDQLQLCSIDYDAHHASESPGWRGQRARHGGWLARLKAAAARRGAPVVCSGPFFDVRHLALDDMADVLHQVVPLVLRARAVLGQDVTLVAHGLAASHQSLIEALGVPVLETARRVTGKALVWHACRPYAAESLPMAALPAIAYEPHAYRAVRFPCKAESDAIFLTPGRTSAVENQREVEHLLGQHGFQTIHLDELTPLQQLGILSQARRIVALHGPGLSLASFNFRGLDEVIELMPPHALDYRFVHALAPLARRYAVVMSAYDARQTRLGASTLERHRRAPFAVDLEALEAALEGETVGEDDRRGERLRMTAGPA